MTGVLGDERLRWLTSQGVRDEVNVAQLVEEHATLLYRVAFSILRSPSEAEDIVQETFLRALQNRGTLSQVDSRRAWLLRVACNLAIDRKRCIPPTQLDEKLAREIVSRELHPEQQVLAAADLTRVLATLEKLPRLERTVLLLTAFDELSVAEIAVMLGKSPSSVRSLTFRARNHLQQRLKGATLSKRPFKSKAGNDNAE